jgi:hypothetical protein
MCGATECERLVKLFAARGQWSPLETSIIVLGIKKRQWKTQEGPEHEPRAIILPAGRRSYLVSPVALLCISTFTFCSSLSEA